MATKRRKKDVPPPEPTRFEIESFAEFDRFEARRFDQAEPSCWNGIVRVRKWRIVAELVDEPVEVIAERLRKLWRESDNHHHWEPLQAEAGRYGVTLDGKEFSRDRKARKTNGN